MRARVALVVGFLGLVLVGLLLEGGRLWQRPRRAGPRETPAEAERPAPRRPAAAPAPAPPSFAARGVLPAPPRPLRGGIAHLRVQVVAPSLPAADDALEHVEVRADDGQRSFAARALPGARPGRCELHVPPGRYTLTAHAPGLVAVERDVVLAPGGAREIVLALDAAVAIRGRVHGAPDGAATHLTAFRAGNRLDGGDANLDGDTFTFEDLRAGDAYDLVFGGKGIRTQVLAGVVAPAEGLEVTLDRLPVLRGAVGFARGASCPFNRVSVVDPAAQAASGGGPGRHEAVADEDSESEDGTAKPLGPDCRFELPIVAASSVVTVTARGEGWHAEAEVAIPPTGDPDPICLNPPCRANPLEGSADLVVSVEAAGSDGTPPYLRVWSGERVCEGEGSTCTLRGLAVGEAIEVSAATTDCQPKARQLVLSSGENHLSFDCRAERERQARRVQGFLRTSGGSAPARVGVRCGDFGDELHPRQTLIFDLLCPRDAATLEYQVTENGPWMAVAIPAAADPALPLPALVEISVGP